MDKINTVEEYVRLKFYSLASKYHLTQQERESKQALLFIHQTIWKIKEVNK